MRKLVVAVTGATGALYAHRFVQRLLATGEIEVHVVVSPWGAVVMQQETGLTVGEWMDSLSGMPVMLHDHANLGASVSSGSFLHDGMVVVPCTMGTLCAISSGLASNLVERAAAVCLKERRRLVLVARETPLSSIQLEQMLRLSQAGAVILPPEPAFYTKPETVMDIVDTTVDRILDILQVRQDHVARWEGVSE